MDERKLEKTHAKALISQKKLVIYTNRKEVVPIGRNNVIFERVKIGSFGPLFA